MPDTLVLSNGDKARAIGRLFDQGREADAYSAMDWMLRSREWPEWLNQVCADIDGRTNNLQEAA